MPRFELIDHTADIGVLAYGSDAREAFANAAHGMFSIIVSPEGVGEDYTREVHIQASDQETLLVSWLNELLYIMDVERVILSRFEITHINQEGLWARVYGEKIDTSRHQLKTAVKAATYHSLKIESDSDFKIQVILDV